jgi:hypothetical protein
VTAKELEKKIIAAGYKFARMNGGSHKQYKAPRPPGTDKHSVSRKPRFETRNLESNSKTSGAEISPAIREVTLC